jgi:transglutaminase-like putative cysteine protease
VLHGFNGRTWSSWQAGPDRNARDRIEVAGEPVTYQITLEPTRQQWVFALDIPWQWSLENTFMGAQQQLARVKPVDQRVIYEATSYTDYRADAGLPRIYRSRYRQLPETGNPRTRELAISLRREAANDAEFIAAVLQRFHEQEYFYTLQPPELGRNPVDEFLFETRQGFCEHYASAFAVLMRAADIPARIVLGYQGGEMNPLGEYLIVRQSDAHAWVEVWLDGRGWVRVDPTAAVAPERIEAGMSGAMLDGSGAGWGLSAPAMWMHRLQLTWDAVNAQWNEWILGYGPDNQNRLMEWLGMENPGWRKMSLTLLGLLIAMIAGISALLIWRYRPPPRDDAAVLYDRFIRKAGMHPRRGETALAFARRLRGRETLSAGEVDAIVACYLAVRYGPPQAASLQRMKALVDAFSPHPSATCAEAP